MHNTLIVFFPAFFLGMAPVQADQNLLANPAFGNPDQLNAWTLFNPDRLAQWDSLDANGSADSGSARLTHDLTGNNGNLLILFQCVPAQPNRHYHFGALALVPTGQNPAIGRPRVVASHFDTDNCSGTQTNAFSQAHTVELNQWQEIGGSLTTTANTGSIRVSLGIQKFATETDDLTAHFDNVFLSIEDSIFADRFESD